MGVTYPRGLTMNNRDYELEYSVATDLIDEIIKWKAWVTIPDWNNKRFRMENPDRMSEAGFWSLIAGVTRMLYDYRDSQELWNSEVIGGRDD